MNKNSLIVFRIFMACLILFEGANWIGLLHVTLVYSRFGLMFIAAIAWVSAEVILARKKHVHASVLVSLLLVAVLLDFLGDILHFYATVPHYDKLLHFFNSGVITFLIYTILKDTFTQANLSTRYRFLFTVTVSAFFGTLYEIEEFLEDVLINHRQIRLGDGYDTAGDLLSNVLGCVLMALIIYYYIERRKKVIPYHEKKLPL